jgi:hypothetical protein
MFTQGCVNGNNSASSSSHRAELDCSFAVSLAPTFVRDDRRLYDGSIGCCRNQGPSGCWVYALRGAASEFAETAWGGEAE